MPWTESRSRDEWLADVRRRGERLRRRRRAVTCAVAGVAVLVPAFALLAVAQPGEQEHQLQLAVGGSVPTTAAIEAAPPSISAGDLLVPTSTVAPAVNTTAADATGSVVLTTTTEVQHRAAPAPDDPVVRATTPSTAVSKSDSVHSSPLLPIPASTTTVPVTADPTLAACPVAEVKVTVTTDKATYAPGETVRWSSTLENRASTTCLVSGRAFFHVEDSAGRTVGSFPTTANYMVPVRAEPGKTITNTGSWDQRDCSVPACSPVGAGTYAVVAEWTEGGPYVGRGPFQIGA